MKTSKILKRACKWLLGIVAAVIVLVLAAVTVVVAYLKPERLTPLVENLANNYLDASVKIGRVELTFWSTFPRLELDVRDLDIESKALENLPLDVKKQLPDSASHLLSLRRFHGAMNLAPLAIGQISLYDITFERPDIFLVQATPDVGNFSILPPSEDETPVEIPDFTIGTFKISGGMPVRYFSIPDGTDISINLATTSLVGKEAPTYSLDISGFTSARLAGITIKNMRVGMDGNIRWNHKEPYKVELDNFKLGLGNVDTRTSLKVDLDSVLTVEKFNFDLPPTPIRDFIALVPREFRGELDKVHAQGSFGARVQLTGPYRPGINPVPSFDAQIQVPGGSLEYDRLKLDNLELALAARVNGKNLDSSVIDLQHFNARGKAIDVTVTATVSDIIKNPEVKGTFKGSLDISRLPKKLLAKIPATVHGKLTADCDYKLRKSYLTPKQFHRITLKGNAELRDFKVSAPMFQSGLYIRDAILKLGTTGSFHNARINADSMLTLSLNIDTIAFHAPGMSLNGRGWGAGIGALNTVTSTDTTQINPIGGGMRIEKLVFLSQADSSRISLRDGVVGGALRRFNGHSRRPLLDLVVKSKRTSYRDPLSYASLRGLDLKIKMHPGTPRIGKRMRHRMDSIAALHPAMSDEQVYREARRIAQASRVVREAVQDSTGAEMIDMKVDGGMRDLLRNWDVKGKLKADRARLFTPYFPVRNTLSNLDMDFTTDSINFHNTRLQSGTSDFTINGSISNIKRALTSRRNSPLEIFFDIHSDTIDVNQLAAAVFAGSAFAEKAASGQSMTLNESETAWENAITQAAPIDSAAPFIVPMNIDATLNIRGQNVIYSDFVFHDFTGSLMMFDGSINLHKLSASTDVGRANVTALYNAPNPDNLSFAFGMQLNDFHISKVMGMIPALDTLMPLLKDIKGIINANVAATTRLDRQMNLDMPSLSAAIKLSGDSLVLMDAKTFKTVSKWLLFKNKKKNMIDHMNVELVVDSSQMQLYPFIFDIDRYRLGVMGSNDLALNFKYHVAVLKSPLPFRFGINLSGNMDKMKVRLGRAKFNEKNAMTVAIADTTRINLVNQIENVFRRGARKGGIKSLKFGTPAPGNISRSSDESADTISASDSLYFKNNGLL